MEHNQTGSGQQSTEGMDEEKRADNDSRARRPLAPAASAAQSQKPPSVRQRWDEFRPSKTAVAWSLVAMVALTMLVGFTWGGWMTSDGAQKMADTSAKNAVIERLAPICVAQFNLDPDRDQKLVALQEGTTYERTKYVTDQTWATLPGETEPTSQVASACASLLMQINE